MIDFFISNGKKYVLRRKIDIEVERNNFIWIVKAPYFGLSSYAENLDDAIDDLNYEFERFSYLISVSIENDINLLKDLIELKERISEDLLRIEEL
jgi:hypothetical protein